jgi:hypothetical protein
VVAEDTFLSGVHFYVEWSGEQCVARDMGSSNGTFLNGQRMTETPLREGDIITAGQSSFALRIVSAVEATVLHPIVPLDETRPMPLPLNAPPLPGAAAAPAAQVMQPMPDLNATQRKLLELMRELSDPIFAVLDGSAASSFLEEARSAGNAVETVSEATGAVLVGFNPESRLAGVFAAEGWGKSWGIHATSRAPIVIVRNHLRRFQTLLTSDGAEFQFRFFNPVLLRGFLPTLSGEEAKTFFGPLSSIMVEGSTPEELILYMPGPSAVLEKRMPLA